MGALAPFSSISRMKWLSVPSIIFRWKVCRIELTGLTLSSRKSNASRRKAKHFKYFRFSVQRSFCWKAYLVNPFLAPWLWVRKVRDVELDGSGQHSQHFPNYRVPGVHTHQGVVVVHELVGLQDPVYGKRALLLWLRFARESLIRLLPPRIKVEVLGERWCQKSLWSSLSLIPRTRKLNGNHKGSRNHSCQTTFVKWYNKKKRNLTRGFNNKKKEKIMRAIRGYLIV